MDFGVALEVDAEAYRRSDLVHGISNSLSRYLRDKEYGGGIEHLVLGFICEKVPPGFESFEKQERKPKFQSRELVPLLGGGRKELRNTYTYDIKVDPARYKGFVHGTDVTRHLRQFLRVQ